MREVPNYARYTWEELQEELARLDRKRDMDGFLALQQEIERRLNRPPLPPVVATEQTVTEPRPSGCLPAFCGWLVGAVVGGVIGIAIASTFDAKLQTLNPADSSALAQVALSQMTAFFGAIMVCSVIGLFMGLRLHERNSV